MPSYGYLLGIMAAQAVFYTILTVLLENLKFTLRDRFVVTEAD